MMKIINVVGARPNFMKVAPIHRAFQRYDDIQSIIVHTGQHYDKRMSKIFFEQLEMPEPHHYLGVGGGSHAQVTANVMIKFEQVILEEKPDVVLVVGDVNSTLACAIVAKKLNIPLVHVESGLRSTDRRMPEELNRIMTDAISDVLFVSEKSGLEHLKREGIDDKKVQFVGNVMIDSLCHFREKSNQLSLLEEMSLKEKDFVLMTMHRPSNVDTAEKLQLMINIISEISALKPVVFPMHPRTKNNLEKYALLKDLEAVEGLTITEPLGYLEFLHLMERSALIVTDSGGIQEETTFLQVPCITLRNNTERPATIEEGTNILVPELNLNNVMNHVRKILSGEVKKGTIPKYWDGKTAERIADYLATYVG